MSIMQSFSLWFHLRFQFFCDEYENMEAPPSIIRMIFAFVSSHRPTHHIFAQTRDLFARRHTPRSPYTPHKTHTPHATLTPHTTPRTRHTRHTEHPENTPPPQNNRHTDRDWQRVTRDTHHCVRSENENQTSFFSIVARETCTENVNQACFFHIWSTDHWFEAGCGFQFNGGSSFSGDYRQPVPLTELKRE